MKNTLILITVLTLSASALAFGGGGGGHHSKRTNTGVDSIGIHTGGAGQVDVHFEECSDPNASRSELGVCECNEGYTPINGVCQVDVCIPYNATGCWICDPVKPTLQAKAEGTPCGGGKQCDGAGHCNCPGGYVDEDGVCQVDACAGFKQNQGYCIASCTSSGGVATYTYDESMCGDYACSSTGECYNPCSGFNSLNAYQRACFTSCTPIKGEADIGSKADGTPCQRDADDISGTSQCISGLCRNLEQECIQQGKISEASGYGCKTVSSWLDSSNECHHSETYAEHGKGCLNINEFFCDGSGNCISNECVDNSACPTGFFCNYSTYNSETCSGSNGRCTPLGEIAQTVSVVKNKDEEVVFTDVILSQKQLNWWSAKNWCLAQGKNLIDISGHKLECYDKDEGITPELITDESVGIQNSDEVLQCCAEGQSNCSSQSATMVALLQLVHNYPAWTNVEISDPQLHCRAFFIHSSVYDDSGIFARSKAWDERALCE